ncbi:Asp-tRNA(Asn)/Glu-tRNA(Gln) amidotransferase subunit GatA [Candidatus Saccharibacteria bacterium]|nr:Asp-tRNA(Asn)/Glu-tRNA(Gln) amidotransferase subunit GatA [Candidatus Saccharibacteria bacterium]NCU43649.1 Asp-tRNA(Asn)/Glu-tRNA(Gln) amidotransferase subunit GatA [Candidatus Saccharibacteria bacterium]
MINIFEIRDRVLAGETTAKAEVEEALAKAQKNEDYNALVSLTPEYALQRAAEIDEKLARGENPGELAGVPFVVKDNFLAFGGPSTASSKMLANFSTPIQATAVKKLEDQGAIFIGKSNLDAFAHGGSTENSAFGVTKNAVDETRVAGGSSGGSAVITALDVVPFALGTDTGGSIRQPASFNGVYGIKPTYGTVSRFGVVAMASSTDTIGAFAKTAAETDLVMRIMSGKDTRDMMTVDDFYETKIGGEILTGNKKIGLISEFMDENVDAEVRARTLEYAGKLKKAGYEIVDVSLPMSKYSLAIYYIIIPAEVSSNLARYDGVRYGLRSGAAKTLGEVYGKSRDEGFEPENKRRIMIGSYVLSSGFYDAYYLQAQKARTLLVQEFNKLFEECDFLLGPVTPTPAFKIGENASDPIKMYLADIMTVPASIAGLPAISAPAGATESGLPIGVQLIGPMKSDADMIALAALVEKMETK